MTERNYNIDLLRILSMFMVLILHCLSGSGALDYLSGLNYWVYWGLEALCIVAVDVFVLITGYFQVKTRFSMRKILHIAACVWSYSLLLTIVVTLYVRGDTSNIIKAAFPLVTKKYWFVNSYIALYLFSPFLNRLIKTITKRQFECLLVLLIVMFSLRLTFLRSTWSQDGSGGMSVQLFILLYCIGAWLRLYGNSIKTRVKPALWLCAYLLLCFMLVAAKRIIICIGIGEDLSNKFYGYASIFTIAAAVSLFLFFLTRKKLTQSIGKAVHTISPHSFSVYIIHFTVNGILWNTLLHVDHWIEKWWTGLAAIVLSTIVVYVVCTGIDMIRTLLFDLIEKMFLKTRISSIYARLTKRIDNLANDIARNG